MADSVFPGEQPDRLEEECGVFGVYAPGEDVARALEPFLGTCEAIRSRGEDRPLGGTGEMARLAGRASAFAGRIAGA